VPLTLATFNVKDLLAPTTDATRAVHEDKLGWIARTLLACDADVVGLEEVGSIDLLRAVLARMDDARYGEPVMGTVDARGIGCALVSRLPLVASSVHTAAELSFPVFRDGDPSPFGARIPLRRGVVHAVLEPEGFGRVDVFVAHFKSRRPVRARDATGKEIPFTTARSHSEGALRSVVWRAAEALFVRGLVDEVLAKRPGALVACVGDLNDVPDSAVLDALRGEGDAALFDCASGVPAAERYSCLHDGRPTQIDHVLASAPLHARLTDARFLNGPLRDHGDVPGEGEVTPTADSDHAPLVVRFA
jgi:endonuclease/exonuclease/phosphatase family metal-dependent hydrolase